jgi:hypothetical protein
VLSTAPEGNQAPPSPPLVATTRKRSRVPSRTSLVRAAKGVVQLSSRTTGRLNSGRRMLPSFVIMGAQRAGTTSLYQALSLHPLVAPAVLHKEVHYFDVSYGRGMGWYRAHFPVEAKARRAAQRDFGRDPLAGEASPYYMFHPHAPARIARDIPGVKLIVLLRDPVERAISAHAHESALGFETEPDFERAVELEPIRLEGELERMLQDPSYNSYSHQHHAYVTRGQYIEQLDRLRKIFGDDQLLVLESHAFFTSPAEEFAKVLDYLGLPQWQPNAFERHNARPRSGTPDGIVKRLYDHYEPYDERLAEFLGEVPSWRT